MGWARALDFSAGLVNIEPAKRYLFDFRRMGRVEPFGMLLVAAALRRLKVEVLLPLALLRRREW